MKKILTNHLLFVFVIIIFVTGMSIFIISNQTKNLQIAFLDVGQGDAIFITTPGGRQILIDTGAKNNLGQKLAHYMQAYDRSLDMIVLTHPDLDHVGSMMSLLDEYIIDTLIHSGLSAGTPAYSAIAKKIQQKNISTITAQSGHIIQLDKNIFLEIYAPDPLHESFDANDFSIVAKLIYQDTSVMLTGDISKIGEYKLVDTYGELLDSDILKVGHHGSQTSTSEKFVNQVSPEYAIISAGCDNRFGHPHAGVLATLYAAKSTILDTCNEGDIVFESDGEEWIKK